MIFSCVLLGLNCSTERNTSSSRAYHELKTRYNIFHNAQESFDNILEDQLTSFSDNGFELLSFYPASAVRENKQTGGPFDVVIDKAEKAINDHSISAKPRRDPTKAYSEDYRKWLNKEEFNPFISNVWLLLGKAHVQNGDYDRALSAFSEMLKIFPDEIDIITEVQIWMLRTFIEMRRFYDAQNLITILKTRKMTPQLERLFTESYTHYLIESEQFQEAAPFVSMVIEEEKNLIRKKYLQSLLAQVYTLVGDYENANKAFEGLKGISTPKELSINASAYQQAFSSGVEKADSIAQLLRQSLNRNVINTHFITDSSESTISLNSSNTFRNSFQLYWEAYLMKSLNYPIQENKIIQKTKREFITNNFSPHMLILLPSDLSDRIDELLFSTANFNFSNFKLRTFNITPVRINKSDAIKLEPFSSLNDVSNYLQVLQSDTIYKSTISYNVTPIIISNENFIILQNNNLNDYKLFYEINIDMMPGDLSPTIVSHKNDSLLKLETNVNNNYIEESLTLDPNLDSDPPATILDPNELKKTNEKINDLKSSLEQKAAKLMEQTKESSTVNSGDKDLKTREQLREERVKQQEQDLKEREREREREIKLREEERERKLIEQNRDSK